jgi:hypothetical protein
MPSQNNGGKEIEGFLTYFAVEENVAASIKIRL